MVLAGCFSSASACTWSIHSNVVPQPTLQFRSTAEEAGIRIWRHATCCTAIKVLIHSSDLENDTYNIGLGCSSSTDKIFVIKLTGNHAAEETYLYLNNLKDALAHDPDLSSLPQDKLSIIMMMLFVCTGYFKAPSRALFFNNFF